jgi:hypothetical protein
VHEKYASTELDSGKRGTLSQTIRISGKAVDEVGYQKIAKQQSQLVSLRIIILDCLLISAAKAEGTNLSELCPRTTSLDLGGNLFETFDEVATICRGLSSLKSLTLE